MHRCASSFRFRDLLRSTRSGLLASWIAVFSLAFVGIASSQPEETIVDERSYLRAYYRFQLDYANPAILQGEGNAYYPMSRLKGDGERRREHAVAMQDKDWTHHVLIKHPQLDERGLYPMLNYPGPPEGWMDPAFDDSRWIRRLAPVQVGKRLLSESDTLEAYPNVQTAYYRAYFHVDDPQEAGDLQLDMTYRGGVRVFLNGEEIARGHLPAGELDLETLAEAYPVEAYINDPAVLDAERPANLRYELVPDVPVPYAQAGKSPKIGGLELKELPKEQWDRVYDLRERRLESVSVPARLLRPGSNVLAIELRRAHIHPIVFNGHSFITWPHSRLTAFELKGRGAGVTTATQRPAGVQVWAEDVTRRVLDRDYLEPGAPPTAWRVAGALGGTYAGQIVVGTDRELNGLRVTVGDLTGDGSDKVLPGNAVRVYGTKPQSYGALGRLGGYRAGFDAVALPHQVVSRYADRGVWEMDPDAQGQHVKKLLGNIQQFDALVDDLPAAIPADSSHPIWLSLRIPPQTAPGVYRGEVVVEADGIAPGSVPMEVTVFDFRVPDARDFKSHVAIDSEYWHLPRMFGVKPFSKEHLEKIRSTYRLLAQIGGGDWIEVQVMAPDKDYGASGEIRWIRRSDGSLDFDFTNLGSYLDVVVEEVGKPEVIAFTVTRRGAPSEVRVFDEATGKEETVNLGPDASDEDRKYYWGQFAVALQEFMRARGLAGAMHWGTPGDEEFDPDLKYVLRLFTPNVRWARASHDSMPDHFYRATSTVYGPNLVRGRPPAGEKAEAVDEERAPIDGLLSAAGWRQPAVMAVNSRTFNSVHYVEGYFDHYAYRLWADRAIVSGYNGIGIFGADGWHPGGVKQRIPGVGPGVARLYWQGDEGMLDSMRAHVLLEGLQETEARIFIERALLGGHVSDSLRQKAIAVLNDLVGRNAHAPAHHKANPMGLLDVPQDWQQFSYRLLDVAAEIANEVGFTVGRDHLALERAVGEMFDVAVPIFGWTAEARNWKVLQHPEWAVPKISSGEVVGEGEVPLEIDLTGQAVGTQLTDEVVIADVASGKSYSMKLDVAVKPALDLVGLTNVFFVPEGGERPLDYSLRNYSGEPIRWQVRIDQPWLRAKPASGEVAPGEQAAIRLTGSASKMTDGRNEATIRLVGAGDAVVNVEPFIGFVDPTALPALPKDREPHYLVDLYEMIDQHHTLTRAWKRGIDGGPPRDGQNVVAVALSRRSEQPGIVDDIGLDLTERDYDIFATEVKYDTGDPAKTGKVRMQVLTDGQIRWDSGLIAPSDEPIPVVIPHLGEVKRMNLVMVRENPERKNVHGKPVWGAPRFYEAGE